MIVVSSILTVENMGDLSEASLLDYIHSSGGKVKNADLMRTFKQFVNNSDLQLRGEEIFFD